MKEAAGEGPWLRGLLAAAVLVILVFLATHQFKDQLRRFLAWRSHHYMAVVERQVSLLL